MTKKLRLNPPRRVTVVDSIIEQIVAQIKDGTLQAGDKLPSERQLMSMLGVSRSSVREAIQGLAAMDLVEARPGDGTFIKEHGPSFGLDMDIETLSDVLQKKMRHHLNQARLLLEEQIVTLAAENIDQESKQDILNALEFYETNLRSWSGYDETNPASVGAWSGHDQVHLAIARATGNPILVHVLKLLLEMVPLSLRDKGFLDTSHEEITHQLHMEGVFHHGFCHAVIEGDAQAALEWMIQHAEFEGQVIDHYYDNLST